MLFLLNSVWLGSQRTMRMTKWHNLSKIRNWHMVRTIVWSRMQLTSSILSPSSTFAFQPSLSKRWLNLNAVIQIGIRSSSGILTRLQELRNKWKKPNGKKTHFRRLLIDNNRSWTTKTVISRVSKMKTGSSRSKKLSCNVFCSKRIETMIKLWRKPCFPGSNWRKPILNVKMSGGNLKQSKGKSYRT